MAYSLRKRMLSRINGWVQIRKRRMSNMKTLIKLVVYLASCALITGVANAQKSPSPGPGSTIRKSNSETDSGKTKSKDGNESKGSDGAITSSEKRTVEKPSNQGCEVSNNVQQMLEELKQSRSKFLEEQKTLRQQLKDSSEDDRSRLRREIQEKRQTFMDHQLAARDEIRKLLVEIKDQFKDHRDVLDAAKEQGRENSRSRKGGGD